MNLLLNTLFQQTFLQEAIPDFIRKVYILLQTPEYESIICWTEDGKTIIIRDPNKLNQEILPEMFHQNTMRSFIRQLNMYNFKKIRKRDSEKELFFRNPHMMRGNIEELVFIKRKKRGYVQQSTLENKEARNVYEKYNIFVYGILTKLSKLLGVSTKTNILPSQLPKFMRDVLQFCNEKVETTTTEECSGRAEHTFAPYQLIQNIMQDSHEDSILSEIPLFESSLNLLDQIYF